MQITLAVRAMHIDNKGKRENFLVGRLSCESMNHAKALTEAIESLAAVADKTGSIGHRCIPFVRVHIPGAGSVMIPPDALTDARNAIDSAINSL